MHESILEPSSKSSSRKLRGSPSPTIRSTCCSRCGASSATWGGRSPDQDAWAGPLTNDQGGPIRIGVPESRPGPARCDSAWRDDPLLERHRYGGKIPCLTARRTFDDDITDGPRTPGDRSLGHP